MEHVEVKEVLVHGDYTKEQKAYMAALRGSAFRAICDYVVFKGTYLEAHPDSLELDICKEFFKSCQLEHTEKEIYFIMGLAEIILRVEKDVDNYIFDAFVKDNLVEPKPKAKRKLKAK